MRSRLRVFGAFILVAFFVPAAGPTAAETLTLGWSGQVQTGEVPPMDPDLALGPPDGACSTFPAGAAMSATYAAFTDGSEHDAGTLAGFLGVRPAVLAAADFLAFDQVGDAHTVFSVSSWTFTAAGGPLVVQAPAGVLATGYLSGAAYAATFGLTDLPPDTGWAFALFDLDAVAGPPDGLAVTVRGDDATPYGRPEIDAMAVLLRGAVPPADSTWGAVKVLYR